MAKKNQEGVKTCKETFSEEIRCKEACEKSKQARFYKDNKKEG